VRIAFRTCHRNRPRRHHHLLTRDLDVTAEPIERARVAQQRLVSMATHIRDNLRNAAVRFFIADTLRRQQLAYCVPVCRFDDPH
jgi:hypothetical protein